MILYNIKMGDTQIAQLLLYAFEKKGKYEKI